ncbi:copper amine oxidase N-terminal domain-containing protein [Paenibacillus hexagrammi]|uniref:Copper amine oxidase N-terminal domain-containing protein n=1 Tax=Paenibacillus hexagrammi TaxID=2908839 RepID=A0ABY3SMA7_9BACL|nr:copper amine oxidase N-terminal domain-containing protein [Paenibacillus sp. YPD9-1]UJF34216.1 copper amine oxidase N-terminal domain-containing protein [Paenibacillus sp. YPD9-1]
MKRWLLSGMAVCTIFAGMGSAHASEQQVQVYIDDKPITFEVQPFIDSGTTMVPFRSAFEALGMKVNWDGDKQEVTAEGEQASLKLTIGSKAVTVGGESKELEVAPLIEQGVTFVPLRFIGEASGREVSWDGRTQTVYIANTEQQIKHTLERQTKLTQEENLEAVMDTVDESSPVYDSTKATLSQIFTVYDLSYTINDMKLMKVDHDQAEVKLTSTAKKVKGPEFKDNKSVAVVQLHRVGGEWKTYQTVIDSIDYLKQDEFKAGEVTLSKEEQTKVLDVIEQDRALSEKEDFTALRKLYADDYPNLDQEWNQWQQLASVFDFKMTNTKVTILEASDDRAVVKVDAKLEKVSGPDFANMETEGITIVKKAEDGTWKIAESDELTITMLH